jgi:YVTN family beta-propeller protein
MMLTRLRTVAFGALVSCGFFSVLACGSPRPEPESKSPPPQDTKASIQGSYGVYVTNEISGDLSVIDPATHRQIGTVRLEKRPRGIRVAPGRGELYIALSGSPISPPGTDESKLPPPDRAADGIGVVNVRTLTMGTILRGPQDPEQTSVSADGARLYVANEDKGTASVLEISSGKTIAEFAVGGEPEGVTTSPDGRFVYVTSEEDNQVSVIDTAVNRVTRQFKVTTRGAASCPATTPVEKGHLHAQTGRPWPL